MNQDYRQGVAHFRSVHMGSATLGYDNGAADAPAASRVCQALQTDSACVAVVMPAYNAADTVENVLRQLPPLVSKIVVVDDGSTDATADRVRECASTDERITLLAHPENRGLSAAMATGLAHALEAGADYTVKMDSDGQMQAEYLPWLLEPLMLGTADYTKGNRFRDFAELRQMPLIRLLGNVMLSFAAKAATGYWNIFDPTNGFVAIRSDVLRQLHFDKLRGYYIFETAILGELYLLGAVVEDVPMKAHYGNEQSHMSIARVGVTYPFRLLWMFLRRIFLWYFLMNFTMASLLMLCGVPMVLFGTLYGVVNWWHHSQFGIGAPTGTVVLPTMMIILGVQFLLSAMHEDLRNVPQRPLRIRPARRGPKQSSAVCIQKQTPSSRPVMSD